MADEPQSPLRDRIIRLIKKIPRGKVATYGQLAKLAGNPRASRLVVWTLNNAFESEKLPWHRVINSKGKISLRPGHGYELQRSLLEDEGVKFAISGIIDLAKFQWSPK